MDNLPICPNCNHTINPNIPHACTEGSLFCASGDSLFFETDNSLIGAEPSEKMILDIYSTPVGCYNLNGGYLELDKKPRWLHRVMVQLILGWKWVENVK